MFKFFLVIFSEKNNNKETESILKNCEKQFSADFLCNIFLWELKQVKQLSIEKYFG